MLTKLILNKPLAATILMFASLFLTGISSTSIALAATACNTTDFEKHYLSSIDGRTTLAITKNLVTWNEAQALAQANGGRLAVIKTADRNAEIVTKFAANFSKAWIGLQDIANTAAWTMEGTPTATLTPSRFTWSNGTSTFTNYAPGQPDDYCTNAETLTNPDRLCLGENWVAMGSDGTWSDEGDHGTTPLKLKGIVEWPNSILDCVREETPPTVIPPETLPGGDTGTVYCKDQANLNLAVCSDTTDGGKICPMDKVACTSVKTDPGCPGGSTLSADKTKCLSDTAPACTSGAYSAATGNCVSDTSYPANGDPIRGGIILQDTGLRHEVCDSYGEWSGNCRFEPDPDFGCHFGATPNILSVTTSQISGTVSNGLCGYDPKQDMVKAAYLQFRCGGQIYTINTGENQPVSFTCPTNDLLWIDGYYYVNGIPSTVCPVGTTPNYIGAPGECVYTAQNEAYSCPAGDTLSLATCYHHLFSTPVCSSGSWNSTTQKCETSPQCQGGAVYSAATNSCVTGICPTAGGTCKSIVGDTTLTADGTPMTWCSPDQCQTDTSGMITPPEEPPPPTDPKDDGVKNPDGSCAGQLYIFNGRTMQCTKDDTRGMIGSIAKIVAIIVASCLTAGALAPLAEGLAVAMSSATALSPALAMSISSAVITSALTSIMNLGIDAATVGVDMQAWAMQSAISLAAAGVGAYLSHTMDGISTYLRPDGSLVKTVTTTTTYADAMATEAAGETMSVGMTAGATLEKMTAVTDGITSYSQIATYSTTIAPAGGVIQSMKDAALGMATTTKQVFVDAANNSITTVTSTLTTDPTILARSMYYAQNIYSEVGPAINAGMTASYQIKKCCHPDKMATSCSPAEFEEWSLQEKKFCHVVGTYCDTKFLGMCMAHKESSCCFTSKLARIIHEQGRPQLKAFGEDGGWGSPKNPNCRGFTPDEFQMLDFGQIDLSEYVADLTDQISNITPQLTSYMNSASGAAADKTKVMAPAGE